jgi:hypothetical protein
MKLLTDVEYCKCILAFPEWINPFIWNICIMQSQSFGGAKGSGKGKSKSKNLPSSKLAWSSSTVRASHLVAPELSGPANETYPAKYNKMIIPSYFPHNHQSAHYPTCDENCSYGQCCCCHYQHRLTSIRDVFSGTGTKDIWTFWCRYRHRCHRVSLTFCPTW